MFSVELKINGAMIGHIYGRNIESLGEGIYRYTYEYYEPETRGIRKGTIVHRQVDGVRHLIALILKDMEER